LNFFLAQTLAALLYHNIIGVVVFIQPLQD